MSHHTVLNTVLASEMLLLKNPILQMQGRVLVWYRSPQKSCHFYIFRYFLVGVGKNEHEVK